MALDIELWDYIMPKVLEFNQGALFFSHVKVAALFVHCVSDMTLPVLPNILVWLL